MVHDGYVTVIAPVEADFLRSFFVDENRCEPCCTGTRLVFSLKRGVVPAPNSPTVSLLFDRLCLERKHAHRALLACARGTSASTFSNVGTSAAVLFQVELNLPRNVCASVAVIMTRWIPRPKSHSLYILHVCRSKCALMSLVLSMPRAYHTYWDRNVSTLCCVGGCSSMNPLSQSACVCA